MFVQNKPLTRFYNKLLWAFWQPSPLWPIMPFLYDVYCKTTTVYNRISLVTGGGGGGSIYFFFIFYMVSSKNRIFKVRKRVKIRNWYNQSPHLTQDSNGKVTTSQLDITNESQEVSPFPAGDHIFNWKRHFADTRWLDLLSFPWKRPPSLKLLSRHFNKQSFIKTAQGPFFIQFNLVARCIPNIQI